MVMSQLPSLRLRIVSSVSRGKQNEVGELPVGKALNKTNVFSAALWQNPARSPSVP